MLVVPCVCSSSHCNLRAYCSCKLFGRLVGLETTVHLVHVEMEVSATDPRAVAHACLVGKDLCVK